MSHTCTHAKVGANRTVGGVVGRASNRKKAQRQAGQKPQVDAATQQALLTLAAGLQALSDENVPSPVSRPCLT